MTETVALLDGDIFAYEQAASAEEPVHWGEGVWTLHSLEAPAIAKLDSRIEAIAKAVQADRIIVALSASDNWRKDVLPTYKSNRDHIRRPMLLKLLKEHLELEYECFIRPTLEADDVLGILSTWPGLKGDKIIVTKDKDLLTIPGRHYLMHKEEFREVTLEEADKLHLTQSLTGDPTDGYAGCPGVGAGTAVEVVEDRTGWEEYEHTFKSGKRKGETERRYRKITCDTVWEAILSQYARVGLGGEEALRQAQVARICRAEDYCFKTKRVKLWHPTKTQ